MPNGDKLREAADLLQSVGMAKGIRINEDGCHCAIGLLDAVHGNEDWDLFPYTDDMEAMLHIVSVRYPSRVISNTLSTRDCSLAQAVTDFNNDVGTTQEELALVLQEAATMRDMTIVEVPVQEAQALEEVVA
jgi:hypothetical protein